MTLIIDVALVIVALTLIPASYRVLTGPRDADRGVAADLVFFAFIGVVALFGLRMTTDIVLDIVLVATVVGFLATLSIARLVTRGQR
ncbi:monovalent cation/H+ antiporter complex subunit F [Hoyosella subflava]|uniref:PH adaptation potassium efflux system protein n=1 Tax=Hoyosella subflava (strain DSM 45089 / JCM 17490 / NBRC 109087 / DQS3-9A1) TaxID=443218 RepID=F6EFA8_HOYSD|nr:monovalent cation/H+ antiporter complex subunit F [Hoyosella subflava]AEF38687.1 PH adaptation potassium efflux system protein [Hoyosella subflava DQS3-9A1]